MTLLFATSNYRSSCQDVMLFRNIRPVCRVKAYSGLISGLSCCLSRAGRSAILNVSNNSNSCGLVGRRRSITSIAFASSIGKCRHVGVRPLTRKRAVIGIVSNSNRRARLHVAIGNHERCALAGVNFRCNVDDNTPARLLNSISGTLTRHP